MERTLKRIQRVLIFLNILQNMPNSVELCYESILKGINNEQRRVEQKN